mgnify:FL=1
MSIKLDTSNGHNKAIVDKFNAIARRYDEWSLLDHILVAWADDQDLENIADSLVARRDEHIANQTHTNKHKQTHTL